MVGRYRDIPGKEIGDRNPGKKIGYRILSWKIRGTGIQVGR
jgi:hypothetical protein